MVQEDLARESGIDFDPGFSGALTSPAAESGAPAKTTDLRASALRDAQEAFVARYGIQIDPEGIVTVRLGEVSPLKFIRDAQKLSLALHGKLAVSSETLVSWMVDDRFVSQSAKLGGVVSVEGVVPGSHHLSSLEQRQFGMRDVSIAHLAAAHAAHFVATGEDLFKSYHVRAADGALHCSPWGLTEYSGVHNEGVHECFAACRAAGASKPSGA